MFSRLTQFTKFAANRFGDAVGRHVFGYDAVEDDKRRKPIVPRNRSEDRELLPEQRRRLISGTRDLARNFAIARGLFEAFGLRLVFPIQTQSGIPELTTSLNR